MRTQSSPTRATSSDVDAWAARLAQCRIKEADATESLQTGELLVDIDVLFSLFDDALTKANAALARAGLVDRVTTRGTGIERSYSLVDANGEERVISISVALQGTAGHINGGAFIGLSRTRLAIYVVPAIHGEQVRWLVAAKGTEFTADLVHDLFLSVFGDDAAATFRLSPLGGSDLFQTPWS
jgi:hypothetical protein